MDASVQQAVLKSARFRFGILKYGRTDRLVTYQPLVLSARTLTALLAGAIKLKEVREAHRRSSNNGSPPFEPLRYFYHEGRRPEDVKIEERPGEDDDFVVLTFGPLDMAAVKFQMPDKV